MTGRRDQILIGVIFFVLYYIIRNKLKQTTLVLRNYFCKMALVVCGNDTSIVYFCTRIFIQNNISTLLVSYVPNLRCLSSRPIRITKNNGRIPTL